MAEKAGRAATNAADPAVAAHHPNVVPMAVRPQLMATVCVKCPFSRVNDLGPASAEADYNLSRSEFQGTRPKGNKKL